MPTKNTNFLFFLGTEAELIKMAPVVSIFKEKSASFKIILTGQNDIRKSPILDYLRVSPYSVLYEKPIKQTPLGLILWFIKTLFNGTLFLQTQVRNSPGKSTWLIIHGDTVTTMLGAIAGKIAGLKIAHVEAGYKSGNMFHPFPEELDRTVASSLSDVLFCPYDSIGFIPKTSKKTVNIGLNTSIDSLNLALKFPNHLRIKRLLNGKKYFIFALHRQETLLNKALVKKTINQLINLKSDLYCVFAQHGPTKKTLVDLGLYDKLTQNKKIISSDRLPYFEYVYLLKEAEFIMTDGVGNQQETYYLGKPCLILRTNTEGLEGLKNNAVLCNNSAKIFNDFASNYEKYRKKPIRANVSPSKIICDYLLR